MSLDERLREHYAGQALDAAQLAEIQRSATPGGWRPTRIGLAVAVAAAVLVLVVAAILSRAPGDEITIADRAPGAPASPLMGHGVVPEGPAALPGVAGGEGVPAEAVGELIITSEPSNCAVYVDDVSRGAAPVRVAGLRPDVVHVVRIEKAGYDGRRVEVLLGEATSRRVHLRLYPVVMESDDSPAPDDPTLRDYQSGSSPDCGGRDANLSVMAIGANSCDVWVGGVAMGPAPFFKRPAPSGDCLVDVRCEPDHWYQRRMALVAGGSDKLIVKGTMWSIGEAPAVTIRPEDRGSPLAKASPSAGAEADTGAAKHLYKTGIALLQGGQTASAIEEFAACAQADPAFCLCYRALGISHARNGNGPQAARYYRLYLEHCPAARDAPQVKKLLEAYGP